MELASEQLRAAATERRDGVTGEGAPEIDGTTSGSAVNRVAATPDALAMLARLAERNGPLMIHQSGGCCDGSSPMCYPQGDFLLGDNDVLLGVLASDDPLPLPGGVPVWIGGAQ